MGLAEELRRAVETEHATSTDGRAKLQIVVAVAAGKKKIDVAYDVPRLSSAVDYINVMAYAFNGPWNSWTGHMSPLHPRQAENTATAQTKNIAFAANYWVT